MVVTMVACVASAQTSLSGVSVRLFVGFRLRSSPQAAFFFLPFFFSFFGVAVSTVSSAGAWSRASAKGCCGGLRSSEATFVGRF